MVVASSSSSVFFFFFLLVVVVTINTVTVTARDMYRTNVIYPGQQMKRWDVLSAPGEYTWGMGDEPNCEFCLRKNRVKSWCLGAATGKGVDCTFTLQRNGELVIYGDTDNRVWNDTIGRGREDYILLLRDNGTIAAYTSPVWTSREWPPLTTSSPLPLPLSQQQQQEEVELALPSSRAAGRKAQHPSNSRYDQNVLYKGEYLTVNEELRSKSYRLVMQQDCNLVLYNAFTAIWQTYTAGSGTNCKLEMRRLGNLVVTNELDDRVWSTGPPRGEGHYILILQDDGNLVVYSTITWFSNS